MGYESDTRAGRARGIDLKKQKSPDLISSDIQLTVFRSDSVARGIRKNPEVASIRTNALTSHAMGCSREKALEAECSGHIGSER
jgi:CheY-like chemotaxis protein